MTAPTTALLLALLAALDLLRSAAGASVRPAQWLAGLAALAWLAHRLGGGRRERLPVLALCALLLPVYVDRSRSIDSDGVHYYAYLRSLLFDGDLDLANDYRLLGHDPAHRNVLPIGAPLLWSPLVVPLAAGLQAARLFGAPAPTGVEPVFAAAVSFANFAYAAAGLLLLQRALARFAPPWAAFGATLVCWLGSPLRFYVSVLPSFAHGVEFFAAALALERALVLRERPSRAAALRAGAACGLAFLARSQDGLLLALPGILLAPRLLRAASRRDAFFQLAVLAAAFAAAALPQLGVWQAMYGTPLLIPHKVIHGDQFLRSAGPELAGTLWSPRGGLFTSYPALLLALPGLALLALRDARYALAAVLPCLAMWYVNSTIFDWYQVRRFTGIVPLLAPGLAALLAPLARSGPLPLLALAFLAWRYDLAVDALRSQPGQPAPVRAVLLQASDALAADAYALLEPRAPAVAARLLGAYTGESLLEAEPVTRIELGRETSLLRLPRPARHLSAPSAEDGVACRWVEGDTQATLFLALAWRGELTLGVGVRPLETVEPVTMEVLWNGRGAGRSVLAPGFAEYRFALPDARAGTNELVLRFDRAPVFRRVRGSGPRQVRPAALSHLTLHRGAPPP